MITTEGIVLKERIVGEQDKFIDILTKESGILEISVKGARKINGKSGSSTQLFAYSRFCINQKGERFFLNSVEPIHIFYGLRSSLTKISLASYFAEVLRYCVDSEAYGGNITRLFLNTLYYMENDLRSEALLKSVFEFRLLSEIGYMPDIVACRGCGAFEPDEMLFSIDDGGFYCKECASDANAEGCMRLKLPILKAMRHIVFSDHERLFNFRVSERAMTKLSAASENYLLSHLERNFRTLDFYKSLI